MQPPHTIICEPVHTATWRPRPAGAPAPDRVFQRLEAGT